MKTEAQEVFKDTIDETFLFAGPYIPRTRKVRVHIHNTESSDTCTLFRVTDVKTGKEYYNQHGNHDPYTLTVVHELLIQCLITLMVRCEVWLWDTKDYVNAANLVVYGIPIPESR